MVLTVIIYNIIGISNLHISFDGNIVLGENSCPNLEILDKEGLQMSQCQSAPFCCFR